MATHAPSTVEHDHRALAEAAGVVERAERAHLAVSGPDALEYLQGQVTNDVQALAPGQGCYAALLNPKGRILGDMRVLVIAPEEVWLDVEPVAREAVMRELSMYKIGRRVQIEDAGAQRTVLSVIGPRSWDVLVEAGLAQGDAPAPEHAWTRGPDDAVIAATDTGYDLLLTPGAAAGAREALVAAGAAPVSPATAEVLRIERGRPRYGTDFGDENLPGEAGIVGRAVSFTKGCYVGQEPVARMFHKGHPNRHLRGLALAAAVEPGAAVTAAGKEVGRVTSAGVSPAHGPIALAILRREVSPGDEVTVASGVAARVVEPPFAGGH